MSPIKTVIDHIAAGRKIDAIKSLRAFTGLGLKEAKDMVEAIEPCIRTRDEMKKREPLAGRVQIVDSKNPDRVLGSIPRPAGSAPRLDGGDCYNVALMPRGFAVSDRPSCNAFADSLSVSYVRFGFRAVNWTIVLTTDASLALLTQIRDFRYPGETDEQAHVRNMYS